MHPQVGASPLWAWLLCLTRFFSRRVHITEATLNHLDKAYEVEDGHGQQRDPYLKEMNIRTYLVIDPRVGGSDAAGWGAGCAGQRPHTPGEGPVEGEWFSLQGCGEVWERPSQGSSKALGKF